MAVADEKAHPPRLVGMQATPVSVGPMLRLIYSLVLQIDSNPMAQGPFPLLSRDTEVSFEE